MDNMTAEISTQPTMPIIPSSKMTYEEFLREYAGQYAEYVDGEIIKNVSVTQQHDDLTLFFARSFKIFCRSQKIG